MELMTEKDKHCVNPRHSCHMKAEGLNFNPRKSWKKASCPVVLTHVTEKSCGLWEPAGKGLGGGTFLRVPSLTTKMLNQRKWRDGKEHANGYNGEWDKIFAFLDLFC